MSRVLNLSLGEGMVFIRCLSEKVGVSAIERLPGGGVRLVCSSSYGAAVFRRKLKRYSMEEDIKREPHRPRTALW